MAAKSEQLSKNQVTPGLRKKESDDVMLTKMVTKTEPIVPRDPETGRHIYTPTAEERKHLTDPKFISYSIDDTGFFVTFRGAKRKITETKHYKTLLEALKAII